MSEATFQRQLRQIALDRVRRIRAHLARQPEDAEQARALRDEALREAHTLKGEARITGRADIATLAHEIEASLEGDVDAAALEAQLGALEALANTSASKEDAPEGLEASLKHTLLRIELEQISELTRACSELRALHRDWAELTRELTALTQSGVTGRLRRVATRARELVFEQDQRTSVLERDLDTLRMLPLSQLFGHLRFAARQIANDLNKPVEVRIEGGTLSVGRQVLDAMSEPLLHLVRNAIDHGLESIDERLRAGKSAVGLLVMRAEQAGRVVRLTIEDDGRGVDTEAMRQALQSRGWASHGEGDAASPEALLQHLFEPGFTTRSEATEISGRGFGLDIVRRRAEGIGGSVRVTSEPGAGTRFVVTVPVSITANPVVSVEVDGATYAFASNEVATVQIMSTVTAQRAGVASLMDVDGRLVPLRDLGELLGGERRTRRDAVIVIESDAGELAVTVDRVLPVTAAVRQGLDPFLEGLSVVRGTVNSAGRLVTLLDGRELQRLARDTTGGDVDAPRDAREPAARARVLVVDDSELTRDVLVAALVGLGCEVVEAVDGARALETLEGADIDLVLTDLDMPVMDGFELLEQIRARAATSRLPVVVLTTRASKSDLERASELGADAYLTKADFKTSELASLVRRHVERDT